MAAGCNVQLLQQVICICDDNHDYGDDDHFEVGDVVGDIVGDGDVVGDDDHVDVGDGDVDHGGTVSNWLQRPTYSTGQFVGELGWGRYDNDDNDGNCDDNDDGGGHHVRYMVTMRMISGSLQWNRGLYEYIRVFSAQGGRVLSGPLS